MNYRHVYMLIIEHAKSEMKNGLRPMSRYYRKDFPNQYFEFHHILPRSLYPNWSSKGSNIVCLTAREHFFCHQLLTKIYPCESMIRALSQFMFRKNDNRSNHYKISSKEYEKFKLEFSKMQSNTHKGYFEKLSSNEQEQAIHKWKLSTQSRTEKQKEETKNLRRKLREQKSEESKQLESKNRSESTKAWMSSKSSEWRKEVLGSSSKGKYWWNNGTESIRAFDCPGEGWVRGRIMPESFYEYFKNKSKNS